MAPGDRALLDSEDTQHLRVLRARIGDILRGTDGCGSEMRLTLLDLSPRGAEVEARTVGPGTRELTGTLSLILPSLHTPRADTVVEKATEMGVRAILVTPTGRSQTTGLATRLERWRRIARAATMQSLGTWIPSIDLVRDLNDALERLQPKQLLFGDPAGESLSSVGRGRRASAAVAVGPEGGLTGDEIAVLERAGGRPIALGPRRLRADTAAIVLLAAVAAALAPCEGPADT